MNMFRTLLFLLLLSSLMGCARLSTPIPYSEAIPTPKDRLFEFQQQNDKRTSSIIVVRDVSFFGGQCFHAIWIDGTLGAKMEPGETATFYLEPGEHLMKIGNVGSGDSICDAHKDRVLRETFLKPNQQKYFRALWNKNDGIPDIQPIGSENISEK